MADKMTLKIEGMGCAKCSDKVTKALGSVDGISDVSVSLDDNAASFELAAPATRDQAVEAIEDAGYDVVA